MFHFITKRFCRWAFQQLSNQNYEVLLNSAHDQLRHHFAGDHALGGERHTKAAFRTWLQRLFTLFPDLQFQIRDIAVTGMPWNTRVAIIWRDFGTTADGQDYENEGVHYLHLKWGKLHALEARLDTQALVKTLDTMAENGYSLAKAKPVQDD